MNSLKLLRLILKILFAVIGWLSSAIALWPLYCSDSISTKYIIFCFVIVLISLLFIYTEVQTYRQDKKRVFIHSSPDKVHKYLYDRICSGGRTVIFTRDFTWANCNQDMITLLRQKACLHELIVCLYKATPTTEELQSLGAEIYTHNLHDLKSRFTITHYGTNCPQITVGSRAASGSYINEQYDRQSNPNVYNIFVELFESTRASAIH